MSNFSEFHQDYEYASHVLFYSGWIFANLVRWQPAVIFTTSCFYSLLFDNSRLDQSQQSELSTYFVSSTDCGPMAVTRPTQPTQAHKRDHAWKVESRRAEQNHVHTIIHAYFCTQLLAHEHTQLQAHHCTQLHAHVYMQLLAHMILPHCMHATAPNHTLAIALAFLTLPNCT